MTKRTTTTRKPRVSPRDAAIVILIEGVQLEAVKAIEAAQTSTRAVIMVASRLACDPALQGLTEAEYTAKIAPQMDKVIDTLPVKSKPQFKTWAKSHVLASAHGVTAQSNAFDKAAQELRKKLEKLGVVAKSGRGRPSGEGKGKETPAAGAPAAGAPAAGAPAAGEPKVTPRTKYQEAAHIVAGGNQELYALILIAFNASNSQQTKKLLMSAYGPSK